MAEPTLKKVLRPRKPSGLTLGAPDLPRSWRTSAEVRAEKERKKAEKEASVVKTKVAKARVNELHEALYREHTDDDQCGPKTGSKKAGTKSAPAAKGTASKSKMKRKPTDVSPPPAEVTELSVNMVSVNNSDSI